MVADCCSALEPLTRLSPITFTGLEQTESELDVLPMSSPPSPVQVFDLYRGHEGQNT